MTAETDRAALREGLAEAIADMLRIQGAEYPYQDADALLAGQLAPLLAKAEADRAHPTLCNDADLNADPQKLRR